MLENKKSWLRDMKEGIREFEQKMRGNFEQVVNSDGDTVEWDGFSEEEVDVMIGNANDFIESFEKHIEELEQEVKDLETEPET